MEELKDFFLFDMQNFILKYKREEDLCNDQYHFKFIVLKELLDAIEQAGDIMRKQ